MSALANKGTFRIATAMSPLPPKADIRPGQDRNSLRRRLTFLFGNDYTGERPGGSNGDSKES